MRPPIPDPKGNINSPLDEFNIEGITLIYQMSFASLSRQNLKSVFGGIFNLATVFGSPFVIAALTFLLRYDENPITISWAMSLLIGFVWFCGTVILHICSSFVMSIFQSKQARKIILTPYGLVRNRQSATTEIPWPSFLWIANLAGDLQFCAFFDVTFIPREAFRSPQEAQEFVQIARELHKTRGTAWCDEWKGKTFGQIL